MYRGENQIQDIIHASLLNVFFVDDTQKIVPADIGSVAEIKRVAALENSEVVEMELKAQFRCSGAEGFVNWVTHTLQIEDTANYEGWDNEEYEFRIFDDPNEMREAIIRKNDETQNNARLVAGFAWDWSEDANAAVDDVDIPEKNFKMPWNARNQRALFAVKDDSVNQVGCIHSVAQHCITCAKEAMACGLSREVVLGCLLHDASEAYLSDVTRPVKKDLPYYREVEDRLQNAIWENYIGRALTEEEKRQIFEIDDRMLSQEFHQLMPTKIGESYKELKREFTCQYEEPEKVKQEYIEMMAALLDG